MEKPALDAEREERLRDEIILDADDEVERALGWYSYLEDQLHFPFTATCMARRPISPLQVGGEVDVMRMTEEAECEHEMFVTIRWEKEGLAVLLSQLEAVYAGEATTQAVEDWHYWVRRGYEF